MLKILASVIAVFALALLVVANSDNVIPHDSLTVHEWGTFTTVAGVDGQAVDWLPLGGPADLPCFVEHFDGNSAVKYSPSFGTILSYAEARSRLKGKVRMETPVLYFYGPRQENMNVAVEFRKGLVTEWYPKAEVVQLGVQEKTLTENGGGSRIEWKGVKVLPDRSPEFASDGRPSHYYTARETDAAPVQVKGKDEKFLFYRGVGNFGVPLSASVTPAGKILIGTNASDALPAFVLFENRGGKIGYRFHGDFKGQQTLDPPRLDGNPATLQRELENTLTASGLLAREAHAMVETWKDSWFEEGTRVFYILPRRAVDEILPLKVSPAPSRVVRTFVGRMEIITPATVKTVADAIAANDAATLTRYGRFLGPISDRIAAKTPAMQAMLDSAYKSFLGEIAASCR